MTAQKRKRPMAVMSVPLTFWAASLNRMIEMGITMGFSLFLRLVCCLVCVSTPIIALFLLLRLVFFVLVWFFWFFGFLSGCCQLAFGFLFGFLSGFSSGFSSSLPLVSLLAPCQAEKCAAKLAQELIITSQGTESLQKITLGAMSRNQMMVATRWNLLRYSGLMWALDTRQV
jgi:hypothetical protein